MFESSAFSPASFAALSWLLDQIITAVKQEQQAGGIKTRRRIVGISPIVSKPWEEDEALLLAGLI